MNKKTSKVRFLALSAVIAALYAVLTYAAAAMNLAFGAVQFRFSEALTVLPAFTPAAIPGLHGGRHQGDDACGAVCGGEIHPLRRRHHYAPAPPF